MKPDLHYDQIYSPESKWNSIHTLMVMIVLQEGYTNQIEYIISYS